MSRQKPIRRFVLSLLASTAIPVWGHAAEPSGTAVRVTPGASAKGNDGSRALKAPADIFQGDRISTDLVGMVQMKFRDDTRVVVGPSSEVAIEEFAFDSNGKASEVTIAAVTGTFRFIGGIGDKNVYSIRTPTATMGIRGAATDLAVGPIGTTMVLWQEGVGEVCVVPPGGRPEEKRTECRDVASGDFIVAPPGGGFAQMDAADRAALIDAFLPYAGSERDLAPEFQIAVAGRPPPAPPPGRSRPHSTYQ